MGFASLTTIIPLFVSTMTSSAILIGLIQAIHNLGWQFPQLLTARRISRMPRFKPFVMYWTVHERLPFLMLGLIALIITRVNITLALSLTFLLLIWQGVGAGMTANAWTNMIGKIIPGEYRATFFGSQSAAANLLASAAAIIAGFTLDHVAAPFGFSLCFLFCSVAMVISWIFLSLTKEQSKLINASAIPALPLWQQVVSILKSNRAFRFYLISRIIGQFGMMAFGFYTVYAVRFLNMDKTTAGIITSIYMITQVVANPILGRIADRFGRKGVLEFGIFSNILSALLAGIAPGLGWFYPVFILAGIANTAFWTIGLAFSLDFGPEQERPTYVGMANTLITPGTIIAPLLGGWLADLVGYPFTFITAAIFGLTALLFLHFLVNGEKGFRF